MRVRNQEIYIFEKLNTNEKSVYYIRVFIFRLIFLLIWTWMYFIFKEKGDIEYIIWPIMIIWFILTSILILTFKGITNGTFKEAKSKTTMKLKKWKNYSEVTERLSIQNVSNHQNYFKSRALKSLVFKQMLDEIILNVGLITIFCIGTLLMYISIESKKSWWAALPHISIIIIWAIISLQIITYIFYKIYKNFIKLKRWFTWGNEKIMRSKIRYYYIDKDKIFFY